MLFENKLSILKNRKRGILYIFFQITVLETNMPSLYLLLEYHWHQSLAKSGKTW